MPPRVSRCMRYGQRRRPNQRGWDKKKVCARNEAVDRISSICRNRSPVISISREKMKRENGDPRFIPRSIPRSIFRGKDEKWRNETITGIENKKRSSFYRMNIEIREVVARVAAIIVHHSSPRHPFPVLQLVPCFKVGNKYDRGDPIARTSILMEQRRTRVSTPISRLWARARFPLGCGDIFSRWIFDRLSLDTRATERP